jgi:hypothetical protein
MKAFIIQLTNKVKDLERERKEKIYQFGKDWEKTKEGKKHINKLGNKKDLLHTLLRVFT